MYFAFGAFLLPRCAKAYIPIICLVCRSSCLPHVYSHNIDNNSAGCGVRCSDCIFACDLFGSGETHYRSWM